MVSLRKSSLGSFSLEACQVRTVEDADDTEEHSCAESITASSQRLPSTETDTGHTASTTAERTSSIPKPAADTTARRTTNTTQCSRACTECTTPDLFLWIPGGPRGQCRLIGNRFSR